MYRLGDVVQFTENHKWCGSLGIVHEVKEYSNGKIRYMIGVPMPQQGTAFIYSMQDEDDFEYIGKAIMVLPRNDDDGE